MKETVKSTCSYCGVGCGVNIEKNTQGKLHVSGDEDHPASMGMLCSKGMNLHYTVMDHSDRLFYPEMRWNKNMPMQRVSWDTALDRAAAIFKTFIDKHGPDSVGFYVSGQCLTEEYYLANKITKGFIGTNNIDTNSRLCMSSAVVGYKKALGEDSVPVSYEDIEIADCFFITGANPAWCHPILFRRIEARKMGAPNEVKMIVVDPRKTQTCQLADLHLQLKPGTDITLYHAIARELIELDAIDKDFIDNHTDGYEAFKEKVYTKTTAAAAKICDVPAADIKLAAKYIAQANGFLSFWAMGLNQSAIGVDKNNALLNLSLITGHIGKPGSGPFSLTGQPNAMGGREVGGLSNMLAVHKGYDDPKARKEVADFWGVNDVPSTPGLTATKMMDSLLDGSMKAIWIVCTNPIVSLPDARKVEAALKKAKFVIVQDISRKSDTVAFADMILPAAGYMEKTGTMTNSDRRISIVRKITEAPGEALSDGEIFIRFAEKMGWKESFPYKNYSDVYDEYVKMTKGTNLDVSGLNYDIITKHGTVQWPYPTGAKEGTKRLFEDKKFFTPNQRAQIITVNEENQSEPLSQDYPLVLTTGRIRDQWHTMTRTGKVNKLNQHIPNPFLEIHPKDALSRGIEDGDTVEISNSRGNARVTAKVTEEIKQGVVFMPMHWGRQLNGDLGRANNLTNKLLDPQSKQPDFKFSAVEVRHISKEKQTIVVIGAGAGAQRFIQKYRELNQTDNLIVYSKEVHPFYNRVMLPDYISGHKDWEDLIKLTKEEYQKLNIDLNIGSSITEIDSINKKVHSDKGVSQPYDKLVVATGSRAFIPPGYPSYLDGAFTMRNRGDADKLRDIIKTGDHVAVVGGGLLGLELADALLQIGIKVSVIQRSSRLMERQLDEIASQLLDEELKDMGLDIYYNDEVKSVNGTASVESIRLKSGKSLDCKAIVYAIGTRPNVEILREAGININFGVQVNEYLQSSDPDIYCIGEIAEFKNTMCGITIAAEEQADVAAEHIYGSPVTLYQGTVPMNILKVHGVNLCSIGVVTPPANDDSYEVITFVDRAERYYKKCIVKEDRLVGAILVGDKSEFLEFKDLIKNKVELGNNRAKLLRSSGGGKKVIGKVVCSCNNVGDGNICQAIKEGHDTLEKISEHTAAGTGCGSCKPEVLAILENELVHEAD